MSKARYVVVLAVVALVVGASGAAQANTTDWDLDTNSRTVTFEPGDGDSLRHTVEVTNNDANESVSISASIGGGHSVVDSPGTLGPGESGDIDVELSESGTESATLRVSGGGKTETVDYTVETPAYIDISGVPDWVDDEGVLRGETRTATITVEEIGGYSGFDGVAVSGDTAGLNVYEIETARVSAGGSARVQVSFSADASAGQYDDIGGTLRLDPNDGYNTDSDQTLESYVAYPAQFGDLNLQAGQFEFDEPRSNGQITMRSEISVENSGDRVLDFQDVELGTMPFEVTILDQPGSIEPTSTATIPVEITSSTERAEGSYPFRVVVEADDTSVDDAELDDTLVVDHEVRLGTSPEQASVGDLPIGNTGSSTVTVSEELGYQDVRNVETRLVDGPSDWISASSPSGTIAAGTSQTVSYQVQFPPAADIGTTYTWTYVIEGDDVESREITVSATPIPLNLDPIRNDLSSTSTGSDSLERTSQETLGMVNEVDERIRSGDIARADVTTVLTFGDSVVRYIEAIAAAEAAIEDGDTGAAQTELVRAAVAYDTMVTYGETIQDDQLRAQSRTVRDAAEPELDDLLAEQESYYQEQLSGDDTSPLQEATVKRELARIASLQGDTERASRLETESEAAFERYRTRVSEGETERQNAEQIWSRMERDIFVTVAGQPLVLNPLQYDEFQSRSDSVLSTYDASVSAFSAAGETGRAETVASERARRSSQITIARWSLLVVSALTALLIVGLTIHTVRGMYWYVQDSEASISGDFLV